MTLLVKYETTSVLYGVFQYIGKFFAPYQRAFVCNIFSINPIDIFPKMKLVKDRKIELLIEPHSM